MERLLFVPSGIICLCLCHVVLVVVVVVVECWWLANAFSGESESEWIIFISSTCVLLQ